MKLVLAIVNNDDSAIVLATLTGKGFFATKLATTGGFLMSGNTTFLIGVDDEKVEEVMQIIKDKSKRRTQMSNSTDSMGNLLEASEVTVGGATMFVLNVENFEKV